MSGLQVETGDGIIKTVSREYSAACFIQGDTIRATALQIPFPHTVAFAIELYDLMSKVQSDKDMTTDRIKNQIGWGGAKLYTPYLSPGADINQGKCAIRKIGYVEPLFCQVQGHTVGLTSDLDSHDGAGGDIHGSNIIGKLIGGPQTSMEGIIGKAIGPQGAVGTENTTQLAARTVELTDVSPLMAADKDTIPVDIDGDAMGL